MFPLGVMSDAATGVETTRLRLAPGDTVLVVSDGITEARNAQDQQWGMKGLLAGLARYGDRRGGALVHAIKNDNSTFAQGVAAANDRTVVAATFLGQT